MSCKAVFCSCCGQGDLMGNPIHPPLGPIAESLSISVLGFFFQLLWVGGFPHMFSSGCHGRTCWGIARQPKPGCYCSTMGWGLCGRPWPTLTKLGFCFTATGKWCQYFKQLHWALAAAGTQCRPTSHPESPQLGRLPCGKCRWAVLAIKIRLPRNTLQINPSSLPLPG